MSAIDTLPGERSFGKDFDYTTWSGKSSLATLYSVPWSSDYRDIAYFPTHTGLHEYLTKRPSLSRPDFSYLKYNQPVKFDVPMNEALKYNYLVVWNPAQPISSTVPDSARWLYYFVNDVIYDSPNSTRLVLQLDVVQTYLREVKFGQVYVEQGHVGLAQSGIDPGSSGLLTQPEGMNLGADYVTLTSRQHVLATAAGEDYDIVVIATTDLEADAGTTANPNLSTAGGSDFENLPNGTSLYIFGSPNQFKQYVSSMKDKPWVMQGIVSVTAVPGGLEDVSVPWPRVTLNGFEVMKPDKTSKLREDFINVFPNFKNVALSYMGTRYDHLKKFSVYPYSIIELTNYAGEPLVLKPELVSGLDLSIVVKYHIAPPSPRIGARPFGYNANAQVPHVPGVDPDIEDNGEVWNVAMWFANFPQFSIVNNGYLQTMAAQAHSLAQSYKDAGWSQNKALTGNSLAYDQSTAGMNLANDLTQSSVNAMAQQTNLANVTTGARAVTGGVGSILSGAASGGGPGALAGAGGALMGGINAGIDINSQNQSNAIQTRLAQSQNASQVGNQGYVRDTNKNYADYATKGDYQNTVNSINAKVEDAKLTQPTSSGTSGGDAFMLSVSELAVTAKLKSIPLGARQTIGDYWLRYGYAINRFASMPVNFQCCETFTYWKVKESYITSAQCPEPIKQALRGIFEKGVTVWHDASKMGQVSVLMENTPIMGEYLVSV